MKRSKLESSSLWYVSRQLEHECMHYEARLPMPKLAACPWHEHLALKFELKQLRGTQHSKIGQQDKNGAYQFRGWSDVVYFESMGTSSLVYFWPLWQRNWLCCMTCRTWLVLSVWRNQCPQVFYLVEYGLHALELAASQHVTENLRSSSYSPLLSVTPANSCHISSLPTASESQIDSTYLLLYQVCIGCPAINSSDYVFEMM